MYIQTPEGVLLPRYVNVDDKCIKVGLLNASIGLFIYWVGVFMVFIYKSNDWYVGLKYVPVHSCFAYVKVRQCTFKILTCKDMKMYI